MEKIRARSALLRGQVSEANAQLRFSGAEVEGQLSTELSTAPPSVLNYVLVFLVF